MNDNHRTPDPDDLADLADVDGLDPVVVGQLRRTLQAVAAATPTEDRSATLLAAIDTRPASTAAEPPAEEPAMELDRPSTTRPPIWRRPAVLATAAAIAVVALIAGAALVSQTDEPVELDPADEGVVVPTGWYLPPDGWDITAVRTDFVDVGESGACPCRTLIAVDEGAQPVALVVRESAGPVEVTDGAAIDVGGRPGELTDVGIDLLALGAGDHHLAIAFSGVDPEAVVALADAWLDRVEAGEDVDTADLPVPAGMSAGGIVDAPAERSAHVVDVTAVERSTGRTVYYQMAPAGAFYSSLVFDAQNVRDQGEQFVVETSIGITPVVALLGGAADLAVGPSFFAEEADDLTVDELDAFLSGLHQVPLAEWHAATADAEVADVVRAAESLFGPPLVDG